MNIKETIMYYVDCYDGSEERVIKKTIAKHHSEFKGQLDAYETVVGCIQWLINHNYLSVLSYNEMTSIQKQYYNDDCCRILNKIKRYNASEFLEEKYGNT